MYSGGSSMRRGFRVMVVVVALLALAACTDSPSDDGGGSGGSQTESVNVAPDFGASPVVINIALTDEGFEPSTVHIPAGRPIRLILRNHGSGEHHYRIAGLIPLQMSWLLEPELDEYDVADMTPEQLAEVGIDGQVDDIEHVLHHLTPSFVPFKAESRAGIKPLPNEVHGYVTEGNLDVMEFFASNTGVFTSEDVLHPEIVGRVIVFKEGA